MTFTPIDSTRYLSDCKRLLVEFLEYWLEVDHGQLFVHVGGVDVMSDPYGTAVSEPWVRPRVVIDTAGDEVDMTLFNSSYSQHNGEHHRLSFALSCAALEAHGGGILCDDLAGAVNRCFASHGGDLEAAGMLVIKRNDDAPSLDSALGLSVNTVKLLTSVDVWGEAVRTLELEMGRFTLTATGQGTYSDGLELETDHTLRLKLLTGIGFYAIDVTVTARNLAGVTSTLTATIPKTRSAGTLIALAPTVTGAKFSDVTDIAVDGTSGLPGEAFAVVNIPEDL